MRGQHSNNDRGYKHDNDLKEVEARPSFCFFHGASLPLRQDSGLPMQDKFIISRSGLRSRA
jgi:hypothetical protein